MGQPTRTRAARECSGDGVASIPLTLMQVQVPKSFNLVVRGVKLHRCANQLGRTSNEIFSRRHYLYCQWLIVIIGQVLPLASFSVTNQSSVSWFNVRIPKTITSNPTAARAIEPKPTHPNTKDVGPTALLTVP